MGSLSIFGFATKIAISPEWEKAYNPLSYKPFLLLAERTGLEPATPGVTGRYSNQLNYHS